MPRTAGRAEDLRQQCPGPPADIDHGLHAVPVAVYQYFRVRHAMPGRAHEGVKACGNLGVRIEVLPECPPENRVIRRSAGTHRGEQAAPGVGHPAAYPVEIEHQMQRGVEQAARWLVEREPACFRLLEQALAHEVAQHPMHRIRVASRGRGQLVDRGSARRDVLGDPQRCHHEKTPRRAQVRQGPEVESWFLGHAIRSVRKTIRSAGVVLYQDITQPGQRSKSKLARSRTGPFRRASVFYGWSMTRTGGAIFVSPFRSMVTR